MKKLTIIALSSLLLSPVVAQAGWQGNWLLGVSGAYNWYDGELDVTADLGPGIAFTQFEDDFDTSGASWGILGGYQVQCNHWLIGGEVNVEWGNETQTRSYALNSEPLPGFGFDASATANYKRDATVGLTGRLGYEVNCWLLPYIRAGIETSRDHMSVALGIDNDSYSRDVSNRSYRFVGGVGVEMPLFSCLTFRAEYNYHSRNRSLDTSGDWAGVPPAAFSTTGYHNHTNTAKASIVYNFNI